MARRRLLMRMAGFYRGKKKSADAVKKQGAGEKDGQTVCLSSASTCVEAD
jgi:hypothetical protein